MFSNWMKIKCLPLASMIDPYRESRWKLLRFWQQQHWHNQIWSQEIKYGINFWRNFYQFDERKWRWICWWNSCLAYGKCPTHCVTSANQHAPILIDGKMSGWLRRPCKLLRRVWPGRIWWSAVHGVHFQCEQIFAIIFHVPEKRNASPHMAGRNAYQRRTDGK